jgi:hypothetical protein
VYQGWGKSWAYSPCCKEQENPEDASETIKSEEGCPGGYPTAAVVAEEVEVVEVMVPISPCGVAMKKCPVTPAQWGMQCKQMSDVCGT